MSSAWWTYSPGDLLLFAPRTWYRLIEMHNAALWPWHLAFVAVGLASIVLRRRAAGRFTALLLAGCWAFAGIAFLQDRYATINWAAAYFAALFVAQALLLALLGGAGLLRFGPDDGPGLALAVVGVAAWPLIAPLLDRPWAQAEVFGVMPDPTAVATLGLLTGVRGRLVWLAMPVPLVWLSVSGLTLWVMEAPEAAAPPAAAALALGVALSRGWRARSRRRRPPRGPAAPR